MLQKGLIALLVVMAAYFVLAVAETGTATFYTPPYTPSACEGNNNVGVMIAAASNALWDGGRACGRVLRVKCIGATNDGVKEPCRGGSVTVKIVDFCPAGCRGTIDLSQEAFSKIADPDAGKIKITFSM